MLPWEIVAHGQTQIAEQDMGRLRTCDCCPARTQLAHHRRVCSVIQHWAQGGQLLT